MKLKLRVRKKILLLALTLALALCLIVSSSVAAAAPQVDEEEAHEECPESLLLKGKELLKQVPDAASLFQGNKGYEDENIEQSWFSPGIPDWLDFPVWSWPFSRSDSLRDSDKVDSNSESKISPYEESDSALSDATVDYGTNEEILEDSQDWAGPWVEKAESVLMSHGFEDTDNDGLLNWPEDSPLVGGQNLDIVVIVTESSGVVIGFVPVVGDATDVVAIVIAEDPFTGECLSKTDQLLFALSLLLVLPVSAKSLKLLGQFLGKSDLDIPVVWIALKGTLNKLKFEPHTWLQRLDKRDSWTFLNVKSLKGTNRVEFKYWRYRIIVGWLSTSSDKLAKKLGYEKFTEGNYRDALMKFTGNSKDKVSELEAHHILPQEFKKNFEQAGIENIHDPRLLVWVDSTSHRRWSNEYSDAWTSFFSHNPKPTKLEILEEARELADEFGYDVLFKISRLPSPRPIPWPVRF